MGTSEEAREVRRQSDRTQALAVVLGVIFVSTGVSQVLGLGSIDWLFDQWGYGPALRVASGVAEVGGGLLLAAPRLAPVGAVLLGGLMVGAVYTHLFRGIPPMAVVPATFLALVGWVGVRRWPRPAHRRHAAAHR